jgi:hypothetical protein
VGKITHPVAFGADRNAQQQALQSKFFGRLEFLIADRLCAGLD